eukprot:evm.model.NODE_45804_length_7337_cov_17.206896.1
MLLVLVALVLGAGGDDGDAGRVRGGVDSACVPLGARLLFQVLVTVKLLLLLLPLFSLSFNLTML